MATAPVVGHGAGMSFTHLPRPTALDSGRDPAHVLYDHACDVLLAAQGLRATAGAEGVEPAIAATFGCLESAVDALAQAIEELADGAVAQVEADPEAASRVALQCQDACRVLRVGRDVMGAIRERVGVAFADVGA
jgi:hypothetical protein